MGAFPPNNGLLYSTFRPFHYLALSQTLKIMGYYNNLITTKQITMRFEIYKDKAGQYRFRLRGDDGKNMLNSEGYLSQTGCKNGIDSVRMNATTDRRYLRLVSKNGESYFNLKASNGKIIGTSERYQNRQDMENNIHSLMNNAVKASVADLT